MGYREEKLAKTSTIPEAAEKKKKELPAELSAGRRGVAAVQPNLPYSVSKHNGQASSRTLWLRRAMKQKQHPYCAHTLSGRPTHRLPLYGYGAFGRENALAQIGPSAVTSLPFSFRTPMFGDSRCLFSSVCAILTAEPCDHSCLYIRCCECWALARSEWEPSEPLWSKNRS